MVRRRCEGMRDWGVLFALLGFFDLLSGHIQHRRSVFSAAALEFLAGTAGAGGVSRGLFGRRGWITKRTDGRSPTCAQRRIGGRGGVTKRSEPGFAVALGELAFGQGHEGVHIGDAGVRGRLRGRFWSWLLVLELFDNGAALTP
jgi:hypothetical protein